MIISAKIDCVNEEHGYTENGFITIAKALEKAGLDIMEVSGPTLIEVEMILIFMRIPKKLLIF